MSTTPAATAQPDMADADLNEPRTLASMPPELLGLVAAACTDVRCLARFAAACTVCSESAHGELRAALPASIKVRGSSLRNDTPRFESSGHVLFQTATSLNVVKATASLVWSTMKKDPGLYALTPALCKKLEESAELPQIDVVFRESTPPPTYTYGIGGIGGGQVVPASNSDTQFGPVDLGPYSYTSDKTSAAGANSGDTLTCIIVLRHDDCPLFVRSSLMHELTTGFRRLIHWRSVEDGFPALAPWTRDAGIRASARDELVASLRSQELWGSMMLDDCSERAKGLHVGSVTEHKLNGGIVVSMLLSRREREDLSLAFACPALAFLGDVDAQELYLPSVHDMSYALIVTRTQDRVGGLGPWDAATFTGRQVLPTDTDIDAVRKRPLLTWKAPRACARFRNAQCCLDETNGGDQFGDGCTGI